LKQNVALALALIRTVGKNEQQAQPMVLHNLDEKFMFNLSTYNSGHVEDSGRKRFHFDATVEKLMQNI